MSSKISGTKLNWILVFVLVVGTANLGVCLRVEVQEIFAATDAGYLTNKSDVLDVLIYCAGLGALLMVITGQLVAIYFAPQRSAPASTGSAAGEGTDKIDPKKEKPQS